MSISLPQLQSMSEKLRVYDVDQDGWEGDPEGSNPRAVEKNLTHVSFHLADVIERKNFSNPDTVCDEIAPDAMQYGLRAARWGKLTLDQVVPTAQQSDAYNTADNLNLYTLSESYFAVASFVRASGVLARQLHDEDHARTKEKALAERADSLRAMSPPFWYNVLSCSLRAVSLI